jgi:hypothetical protein
MMKKAQTRVEVAESRGASLLQRKCGCGQHTIGGGRCDECRKPRLVVGPADDHFEREADRVADAALAQKRGSRLAVTPVGAQLRREPQPGDESPDVDLQTEEQIQRLRGGGERLGKAERRFFEPRFAMDFSSVRVHDGEAAAILARRVGAEAFTVGRDIFFGSGRHDFTLPGGLHLLAHELTHVAQQSSAAAEQSSIRRAQIPYRDLTWADFKMSPPPGNSLEAVTSSGFNTPRWNPKQSAVATGNDCKIGKKNEKEYKATATIDPAIYDSIAAYMDQDKSWVKARRKDGGKNFCTVTMPADCQQKFDQRAAQAKSQCAQAANDCRAAFKKSGNAPYKVLVGGVEIEATSAGDCGKKLAPECEKEMGKSISYSLEDVQHKEYAKATSKAECSDQTFQSSCLTKEADDSAKLLKHEQGHFDISNVLAEKAKADMKSRAAAFKAERTECGKLAATSAAGKEATEFGKQLASRGGEWIDSKDKAESDYDDPSAGTDHGKKDAEQKSWEGKISGGLKEYDLIPTPKAPAEISPGNQPEPGTNPPAPIPPAPAPKKK